MSHALQNHGCVLVMVKRVLSSGQGPDKPRLLSATKDSLVISFENLNITNWKYLYNAIAVSPDNRTHEEACDTNSNTCKIGGLSPATLYSVYMQAFIPNSTDDDPIGSELSEALIVHTTGKILHISFIFQSHLMGRYAAGRTFLVLWFHIFLFLYFKELTGFRRR